ncbi:hypothetical protein E2C01_092308 [Portunus trituberculatus]|uniref:Uncharacterized protein n=1 Tax=Portunus trituberculatus TaxID=210409 RepID=A0A5B7JJR5_PORTR|nr:hypothetical protein [Portunus trituberculatus]
MNLAWNKVWPECAHDFLGFAEDDIGAIRRAGLDEVDDDGVQDLLESHTEHLSNDELIEQDKASQEAEKEGDKEEEPVRGLDIKTLRECLSGIEKPLETLKKSDPNPARSSKGVQDPVRHAIPVTPADPATAGLSTSAADGSTAGPSSIPSLFKPVKRANPATAVPSASASDSTDDVVSLFAHSAEDE